MNRFIRCLLFLAVAGLLTPPLHAATLYWVNTGTSGDINTPANWTGNVLPTAGDWMWVGAVSPELSTAVANINADYTNNATPPEYLYVGRGAGTNGTVNQTGGSLILNTGLRGLGREGGTGTYNMSGGSLTMNGISNVPWLIGAGAGSTGTMNLTGTAAISVTSYLPTGTNEAAHIGELGGTANVTLNDSATVNVAGNFDVGVGAGGTGFVNLKGFSALNTTAGWAIIGGANSATTLGGTGTLNIQDSATLNANTLFVGHNGASGTLNATGGTILVSGYWQVANGENFNATTTGTATMTNCTFTMTSNSGVNIGVNTAATGIWNIGANATVTTGGTTFIGHQRGNGTVNMTGNANWTSNNGDLQIGNSERYWLAPTTGKLNMSDDSILTENGYIVLGATDQNGSGTITMNNNASLHQVDATKGLLIGYMGGNGTLTINDTATFQTDGGVFMGAVPGAINSGVTYWDVNNKSVINLNGGTLSTPTIIGAGASSSQTMNFNGGTLQATGSGVYLMTRTAGTMHVNVLAGGAKIDTNGYDVSIVEPLAHSGAGNDGGLTKSGIGNLALFGANTYNGPTAVEGGALTIDRNASLATPSVTLAGGATLTVNAASNLGALASLNASANSTLGFALTSSAAAPNGITTALMPTTTGLSFAMDAQGRTLDTAGTYTVVQGFTGGVPAAGILVATNMRQYQATASILANKITMNVTNTNFTAKTLTWSPGPNTNWDINLSANWYDPTFNTETFYNLDTVSFDDNGLLAAGKIVSIFGQVHPLDITIACSDTTSPFWFLGSGAVTGVGTTLTKTGVGTAVFNNSGGINITGDIFLSGGTLAFGASSTPPAGTPPIPNGSAIGPTTLPGNVQFSNSGMIGVEGGPVTLTGTVSDVAGSGLRKSGRGRLILTAASNPLTGPTVITAGSLQVSALANGGFASSIGNQTSDPANLVLGGVLYYTGPALTGASAWDRGFTADAMNTSISGNGGIATMNDLTLTGAIVPGTTAAGAGGYFTLDGNGSAKITFQNPVAGTQDFGNHYVVGNGGQIVFNGAAGTTFSATGFWFGSDLFANPNVTVTINAGNHLAPTGTGNALGIGWGVGFTGTSTAVVNMLGDSSITTPGRLFVGVSNRTKANGTLNMYGTSKLVGSLDVLVGNQGSTGVLNMYEDSSVSATTAGYIGNDNGWGNGTGTVTLNNKASYSVGTSLDIGRNYATGTVILNDNAKMNVGTSAYWGRYTGNATTTLNNSAEFNAVTAANIGDEMGTATVTLNDSSIFNAATTNVGVWGGNGTVNVNGNAQLTANTIQVCYNWSATPADNHGTVNVNGTGAVVSATGEIIIGANGGQDGTWNQNAGHTTVGLKLVVGEYDYTDAAASRTAGIGVLNLTGGTVTTPVVTTRSAYSAEIIGPATGTVNFNGGTLQASAASTDFIATDDPLASLTLTVKKNAATGLGAVIDTQAFDVAITKVLLHDAAGPAIDGGLKKLGSGALSLTSALAYTGNTTVDAGVLTLAAPLSTPSAMVYVATGATLNAPSITADTLTIGGPPLAVAAAAVPEPSALVLLALACFTLAGAYFRRK